MKDKVMNTREISEIKQRFTKDNCTITKMHGIYVDKNKDIVTKIDENFLDLPEDEFYKYLDIVKEIYQPKQVDNKNITLDIISDNTISSDLNGVRSCGLKTETPSEEKIYKIIIDNYSGCLNGYLILLFYDVYDIPKVTKDNIKLDDSDEIYEYITCAICPVKLTNPALGYDKFDNEFKPVEREWIVCKPAAGFVWPAFEDRSEDVQKLLYYTANPKFPDHELIESLDCEDKLTAAEYNQKFEELFADIIESESECDRILSAVNAALFAYAPDINEKKISDERLNDKEFETVLSSCNIVSGYRDSLVKNYYNAFQNEWPKMNWIYNKKYRAKHYAAERKNKARQLLTQASNALNHNGGSELADEIDKYLEKMR